MKLNNLMSLNYDENQAFNNPSIFSLGTTIPQTKIYTLENTAFFNEISLIGDSIVSNQINEEIDLVILSEPECEIIEESTISDFINKYNHVVSVASSRNIKVIHIVSNYKWYQLFQDTILANDIPLYLTNTNYSKLKNFIQDENKFIVDDFLYLKDFNLYSNKVDNNLLIDLTLSDTNRNFYNSNLDELLKVIPKFEKTTILIAEDSYFPEINLHNVEIVEQNISFSNILEDHSYIYVFTNKPYDTSHLYKIYYYAANSKVVYSNYNFELNNKIPSVILNLTENLELVEPLNYNDAFEILNENRNTILYKHTILNVIQDIYKTSFDKIFMEPLRINKTLDYFESDMFIDYEESDHLMTDLTLNNVKYDLEHTLAFPILFLGKQRVIFDASSLSKKNGLGEVEMKKEGIVKQSFTDKKRLSMVVPIHNNGKYLKFKCFRSMKSLSCFKNLEIIFVDDGSTDKQTLRIIQDILESNDIVYKRFSEGSGSASRPRNEGVQLATTDLITYLDPDNEAVDDGYSILLKEIYSDPELDMVVGNIIREDNEKRNSIRYSTKITRALNSDVITNPREALIKTNLTVQSIQGLIVKKNIITENNINMVEAAAGQDTLYFQQLLLKCNKVKVIDHMIHSYYAFVEGSITNTVTHKFFEKFYKVEQERIKFLIEENLIEEYMNVKFNPYMSNWYMEKYKAVPVYDKEESYDFILKIVDLYRDYSKDFSETILEFVGK